MDFTVFFAKVVGRRKTNLIRHLTDSYAHMPTALNLAGGMPNTKTFPYKEILVTYNDGSQITVKDEELDAALQYAPSQGYYPLIKLWREFQKTWHSPKYTDWDVIFTPGAQDGCNKVFEMFVDEGQPVLVQAPLYAGTIGALYSVNSEVIEINQDDKGIIPKEIKKVCEQRLRNNQAMPKLLYVNPTGSNPTGTNLPDDRTVEIYNLAKKYNFLILEDDPYYFLYFQDKRSTSFFSLDTEGRVIRCDSFSKILSSGFRLGVVSAHKTVIDKLNLHIQHSNLHAPTISQVLVHNLLKSWSQEKFQQHIHKIQDFYRNKRDMMLSALKKHLTGLAEWNVPDGGMFIWIKITGIKNTRDFALEDCVNEGLLLLPGVAFNYDPNKPSSYIRLSYSYATPEEVDKAINILATLIKKQTVKCDD